MSDTLVLFVSDRPRWLRIVDRQIVERGEGAPGFEAEVDRVVAVVPAADVAIQHALLPDLSDPQAAAAARLRVGTEAIAPLDTLHVAIGPASEAGERTVVTIDRARMQLRLDEAALLGYDPDIVMPAPLLVARPELGHVRGDLGTETIVRGPDHAFADDPALTPLLVPGQIATLDRDLLEAGLVDAVLDPEVNLRQGPFAKRRRWGIDWSLVRTIARLAAALAVATLLLQIFQLIRLNAATQDAIAAQTEVASRALPGVKITSPLVQLRERIALRSGPGGGMMPLAAVVAGAANPVSNLELTTMVFDGAGTLRVTTRAASPADLASFERQLAASGLVATPGPVMIDQGRQLRDYTIAMP